MTRCRDLTSPCQLLCQDSALPLLLPGFSMAGSCQPSKPRESQRGREGGAKGHVRMGSTSPRRLSPWPLLLLPFVDSDKKACGWRQLCKQKASRRAGRALGPNPASLTQGRLLRGLCVQLLLGSLEQCGHDSQQRWLRPSGSRITNPRDQRSSSPCVRTSSLRVM